MNLDLRTYKVQINAVIQTVKQSAERQTNIHHDLATLSATIHLPIVAAYYFASLELGLTDNIKESIIKLCKFHQIEEVLGYEEIIAELGKS
jgi:hypothetical protein